jgi:hypothetical protein
MNGSATACIAMADCTRVSTPAPFDGGLQRERVNHRRQHAHVVGGGVFDACGGKRRPTHDVPAADHHSGLHAQLVNGNHLAREVVDGVGVQADPLLPCERLPAEFDQHAPPARRRFGACHASEKYTRPHRLTQIPQPYGAESPSRIAESPIAQTGRWNGMFSAIAIALAIACVVGAYSLLRDALDEVW